MSDFERINRSRPGKIVDMLRVIDASARANKVPREEVSTLLAPVVEKLAGMTYQTSREAQPAAPPTPDPPPVITTHDGNLITALGMLLQRHDPAKVEAALGWVIRHRALK